MIHSSHHLPDDSAEDISNNRRGRDRHTYTVTLEYAYSRVSEENALMPCRGMALSTNISEGGMGIFAPEPLEPGQPLTLYSQNLSSRPRGASVRWCVRHSDTLYKIGLCFN